MTHLVNSLQVIVRFILKYVETAARSKTKSGIVMYLASKTHFILPETVDEVYFHCAALETYTTRKMLDEEGT